MITIVQDKDTYIISFQYDADIVQMVKNVPGRTYIPNRKYWTIPQDRLGFFLVQLQGTPWEYDYRIYNEEQIDENDTLDATQVIPDVDLSGVPLYVAEGEELFPHQLDFMRFAIDHQRQNGMYGGFVLADSPGMGKTAEAMNLALYNKQFNNTEHCLIIACVNSAKYNWIYDIEKHTNGEYVPYLLGSRLKRDGTIKYDGSSADKLQDLNCGKMYGDLNGKPLPYFLIINIEAFHYSQRKKYLIRERLGVLINAGYIGMIIMDEAHRNCSAKSLSGKQLLKLKDTTSSVPVEWLPISGTPIVNKPTDAYTMLRLIGAHSYRSYYDWCQNFCIYGGFGEHTLLKYKNIPQLKQMLQGNMLRRVKDSSLGLPPKIHTVEYVENTPYQEKLYNALRKTAKEQKDTALASKEPASNFLKLRQVSGSPELVDDTLQIDSKYLAKNAKLTRLLDMVETIVENDEKVIIFSNWVQPLRTVYRFLAAKYKVCCYTGTMPIEDREKHKKVFLENPEYKIIIGTIGALGVSHNLPVASNVIFYDLPWNPATMEQAEDRGHRLDSTASILNIYSLIAKGTVDEIVYNIIMRKSGMSKYLVDNDMDFKANPELYDILLSMGNQKH